MREKGTESRVLVGVDDGELREQGRDRGGIRSEVRGRLSTHGTVSRGEGHGALRFAQGRKNSREVNVRRRSLGGVRGESLGASQSVWEVGSMGGQRSSAGGKTILDGGRRFGWDTRRVPNRYDYYLEGHGINRASPGRAKSSLESQCVGSVGDWVVPESLPTPSLDVVGIAVV
jgi:hypothetical protein